MNVVQQGLKQLKLNINITEDWAERRRRTRAAAPLQTDRQHEGKEELSTISTVTLSLEEKEKTRLL